MISTGHTHKEPGLLGPNSKSLSKIIHEYNIIRFQKQNYPVGYNFQNPSSQGRAALRTVTLFCQGAVRSFFNFSSTLLHRRRLVSSLFPVVATLFFAWLVYLAGEAMMGGVQ